ncbi:MAG TPA: hypothetical protein VGB00_19675 [Pyrinomonadaceae bacterium]
MKIRRALIIFIMFAAINALPVYAQDKSIMSLADEYALALRKFQTQRTRASLEGVVRKGNAVGEKLSELEDLSEAEYALLEKKMKGFVVNRDETLVIEPDLKFFAQLAKTRGTTADTAFFGLMHEIKPDNVWAAYNERQTDYSGCTVYGKGVLTALYGKALRFKKAYPQAYAVDINEEINEILEEFTGGTCACGNRAGVEREFRSFIKTFPKDKNTPAIKKRLANLGNNKTFRFNCQSG